MGLLATLILATVFTVCQRIEYSCAGFTIADGIYRSVFFASTGAHRFHVVLGTLFLIARTFRVLYRHLTNAHHVRLQFRIVYWHFVDVV
jgi:cytochrome c oxidase subunit 3